jgi:hypothetical protein
MSDKKVIDPLDKLIRRTARCGMTDGTVMRIEFVSGFELFNTRPYHNYETWSQGYHVSGLGVFAKAEDLDDAIKAWAALVERKRKGENLGAWQLSECPGLLPDWEVPRSE